MPTLPPLPSAPAPDEPRARIARFLKATALASPAASVQPLTPDASDRRYYRVTDTSCPPMVLAVHTGPIDFTRSTFAGVQRLLAQMPVPVPRVLGHSDALGIIAQEDLGDVTLQTWLDGATADARLDRYREAVGLIAAMQDWGARLASPDYPPYALAFDVEKLTFELDFFVTHFLEGSRGLRLTAAWRDAWRRESATLIEALAAEPRVLCHRDYHSRNLMLHHGRLHVIDFQDARMGPDTYDLASLLRDSYVTLPDSEVAALIGHFLTLRVAGAALTRPDATEFLRRFHLMALQRNLKALGTFGFQAVSRANTSYLQYVPRTLGYVRAYLSSDARFAPLQTLLAEHLPELR